MLGVHVDRIAIMTITGVVVSSCEVKPPILPINISLWCNCLEASLSKLCVRLRIASSLRLTYGRVNCAWSGAQARRHLLLDHLLRRIQMLFHLY